MDYEAIFEALLFLAGETGIEAEQLQKAYNLDESTVIDCLQQLKEKYENDNDSGLEVIQNKKTFFIKTKSYLASKIDLFLEKYMGKSLSNSELNTLAIVAFKQPIMRIQVDELRGVNSSQILHNLEKKQLIMSKKSEALGRPKVYRTTNYFLTYFGLNDLRDLLKIPKLDAKLLKEKELF
ncbi:MAG: SMC-Scp complex subunit ScpB [Bombilactobacillus mellifer]|nr:SMC-Scp complex subunit ScpB [Bombilactobacillus mellifer]